MEQFQSDLKTSKSAQGPIAASALWRLITFFRAPAHGRRSLRFIAGAALIAGSFLVYLAYPVILLYLPFTGKFKVGATFAVWVLSWGTFSAGISLTGPEGYAWLRVLWTRMTGGNGGKGAG